MKLAIITVDYEAHWGMPHDGERYDLTATTQRLLGVLEQHAAPAVFFVVGRLVAERPALVEQIAAAGHEIALHGWRHENLARLDDAGLRRLDQGLARSEELIEQITGRRPAGFRAPYLLWPEFYRREVNVMLAHHGYRWVSNCKVSYPEELLRPGRLLAPAYRLVRRRPSLLTGRSSRLLVDLLNRRPSQRLAVARPRRGSRSPARSHLAPFWRDGLLEIPIHCPVDTEMLGLPAPVEVTSDALLDYARFTTRHALRRASVVPVYTFHDWLIGSANRIVVLEDILAVLRTRGYATSTVSAAWDRLVPAPPPVPPTAASTTALSTPHP